MNAEDYRCFDCIHRLVCMKRSELMNLQHELTLMLEHATFNRETHGVIKVKDLAYTKPVRIDCKHYIKEDNENER